MPPVTQWSNKEVTIAIYFRSRGFRTKSVHCLLKRRGFERSCYAIESKIALVLKRHPQLRGSKRLWDWRTVDRWIDDLLGSHEMANTLIDFASEDAEDVVLVSWMLYFHLHSYCSYFIRTNQFLTSWENFQSISILGPRGIRTYPWWRPSLIRCEPLPVTIKDVN